MAELEHLLRNQDFITCARGMDGSHYYVLVPESYCETAGPDLAILDVLTGLATLAGALVEL